MRRPGSWAEPPLDRKSRRCSRDRCPSLYWRPIGDRWLDQPKRAILTESRVASVRERVASLFQLHVPAGMATASPSAVGCARRTRVRRQTGSTRPLAPYRNREQHACASVIASQHANDLNAHYVPEPWTGDLAHARIHFVSSNPSVNAAERYPTRSGQTL